MNLLLHVCCGPCAAYPFSVLRAEGLEVKGWFFNPNIHPYQEFRRRLEALEQLATRWDLTVAYEHRYGLRDYLRQVVFNEEQRCRICYQMRLSATARKTREAGLDAFSSTLLFSRHQQHELIRRLGAEAAKREDVTFYYRDFRAGWRQGVDIAKNLALYRQSYCGCIYSEQERYEKKQPE
ncbi:MAG: epoxyqueuosine reductase QueH [Desulfobulbaceae bacterium]|nr:MAG: epoxyqueuosine reductase QueH [Desulfobulbaceae bacterium]